MITALYYRLLPLLVLLAGYNSVYAMHTLARTNALRKVFARTYAHATRRFYATDRIINGFRLSSTNNQSNDEQSNSREQQSNEQRYQAFKNTLYTTGILAGVGISSNDSDNDFRNTYLLERNAYLLKCLKFISKSEKVFNKAIAKKSYSVALKIFNQRKKFIADFVETLDPQEIEIVFCILKEHESNPTKKITELWLEYNILQTTINNLIAHNDQNYYLRHRHIIQEFIQAGHDIHMPVTSSDSTLLHIAIYFNDLETAAYLIKYGASIHTRNRSGQTPLFFARTYAAYNFLKKQGALLTVKDNDGDSLLPYAFNQGYDLQLVKEYAHLEQDPSPVCNYLIEASHYGNPYEWTGKAHAYLATIPKSRQNTKDSCIALIKLLNIQASYQNMKKQNPCPPPCPSPCSTSEKAIRENKTGACHAYRLFLPLIATLDIHSTHFCTCYAYSCSNSDKFT